MKGVRARGAVAVAALVLAIARQASAADDGPQRFARANEALAGERVEDAIAELEALADRGVHDAAASFNRGLAYAHRVRLGREVPGDLGRAVFAFEEARRLTRSDAVASECALALEALRSEIARRRAHAGEPADLAPDSTPWWTVVHLASEGTWAALASVASLVATLTVIALSLAVNRRARVALFTGGGIAMALLLVALPLAVGARHERLHVTEAVVVGERARLFGPDHLVLSDRLSLPEGARVRVEERSAQWVRISSAWGDGYLPAQRALVLPR